MTERQLQTWLDKDVELVDRVLVASKMDAFEFGRLLYDATMTLDPYDKVNFKEMAFTRIRARQRILQWDGGYELLKHEAKTR